MLRLPTTGVNIGYTTHRIDIEHIGYNDKGMVWRVTHEGRVILETTRLPALDACRYLLALGKTAIWSCFETQSRSSLWTS